MTYSEWLATQLPCRVQKISIDAGFTCPNRDGTKGTGGCVYCNNRSFSPAYTGHGKSIREQLEEGKRFFARKYPEMKYLAYFQSYSNTYAPTDTLRRRYEEALSVEGVAGLVVATRPDCLSQETLDLLADLARQTFLIVEYGVETANDATLRLIHRCHTFDDSRRAIEQTAARGITTSAHIILGLPGEDADECLRQAPLISALPIRLVKLHQLQVVRGTALARAYLSKEDSPLKPRLFSLDEYLSLVRRYTALLRPDIVVERYVSETPSSLLIAPRWGVKNHEFAAMV